jgi:alcohol dehydrogenase (cytochrome c)
MKALLLATALALALPVGGHAQTAEELVKGATDTGNVLNYGMGYNLQRFEPRRVCRRL